MNVHELPLVAFTILAQMSVGSFVVLGVIHLFGIRKHGHGAVDKLSDPALYAIGPAMVLGLIASIFHLGSPMNALNTINHLGSSWLSREIFFGSAFACMGAVFAVVQWRRWLTPLLRQILAGATALVGLVLVYSMSMVYMLPTVPAWNHWATPVTFFTTTFLLGALAVGAALVIVYTYRQRTTATAGSTDAVATETGTEASGGVDVATAVVVEIDDQTRASTNALLRSSLRMIAAASIVLLGIEFVVLPTYALDLATGNANAQASAATLMTAGGAVLLTRLILVFLGAGLLGFFLYRSAARGHQRHLVYLATSAFVLVFASETIGRILFYSSFDRIGI
ncbi:dimethyl sulfoxide reductase anchor subunit family protein [Cellulomonas chengniuliangii]|uniref:Dimethyl sulfoxide reductase anchor subunit n=1 Tax=Cellulomonas chengniuliangii TaxID=2968084 RepID=A0ABY5KXU0_9CELL|nr:DmsC/YnfH family molybdoenzyme membrane anchor subunit [Cellulomonas chengniuliangii]MCC2307916.1 dimethyl sulfoxide reductase anchor subunit [Cellulomonas chengniuliangii]UUI75335.1 dimethyl sulfoxide reductase anchor subunit [Cellulomonas chengniuliangii]